MTPMQALQAGAPADDDAALAARVGGGDAAAFELLMRRHNRRLYRLARSMLRDAAEAEDALQDAYLAAYRSMASFRAEAQAINESIQARRLQLGTISAERATA